MKSTILLSLVSVACLGTSHAALIAHYNMEQTGSPLVDQIGGEQATQGGGSGYTYGVAGPAGFGNGISLAAAGSWQIDPAGSIALGALANDITVAAWINVEAGRHGKGTGGNARFDRIIGDDAAWDGDAWAFGLQWSSATDATIGFTKNGIVDINSSSIALTRGTWLHVAATVSSTAGVTFYLNGTAVGNTANTTNMNTGTDAFGIGRAYGGGEPQWFPGSIDEIRVYDNVLTQAEIAELMIPEPSTAALGLLAGGMIVLRRRR